MYTLHIASKQNKHNKTKIKYKMIKQKSNTIESQINNKLKKIKLKTKTDKKNIYIKKNIILMIFTVVSQMNCKKC